MALIGKLHPMLVHFPIALVLAAAGAELRAIITRRSTWRVIAIASIRAGAATGVVAAIAGWLLMSAPFIEPTRSLTLHRWTGLASSAAATAAALMSTRPYVQSNRSALAYQTALFGAAAFVGIAGHLGAALVWGPDFLWR
jgi:uncharacterized membrane protein